MVNSAVVVGAKIVNAVAVLAASVVYAVAVVDTTVVVVVIINGVRALVFVMLVVTVLIVVVFSIFGTEVEASTVLSAVVFGEVSLALVALVKSSDTFGVAVLRAVSMLCVSLSAVEEVFEADAEALEPSVVAVLFSGIFCVLGAMLSDGETNCSLFVMFKNADMTGVVIVAFVVLFVRLVKERVAIVHLVVLFKPLVIEGVVIVSSVVLFKPLVIEGVVIVSSIVLFVRLIMIGVVVVSVIKFE